MRSRPSGWAPPGPLPPAAEGDLSLLPGPGETLDCLSGHWKIFQLRRGHRYSTDDLLTAWYAVQPFLAQGEPPRSYLDLGCGVGSVCLLVLWHFPDLRAVGVEAQARSCELARRSLRYNGAFHRARVLQGDFRAPGALSPLETFDLVTGSPPYLRADEGRRSDRAQRGPCRFQDLGGARDYLAAMAAHLAPGGAAVWVHATRTLRENLAAAEEVGLGAVQWRPVVFREGTRSLITLFRARSPSPGSLGPSLFEEPPLVVRGTDGQWSPEFRAIRATMGFPV